LRVNSGTKIASEKLIDQRSTANSQQLP